MVRNKKTPLVAIISIIAIVILSVIIIKYLPQQTATGTGFTPIFCNDYEFTCCGGKMTERSDISLNYDQDFWQCPTTSIKCKIYWSTNNNPNLYKGSTGCGIVGGINKYFTCSNAVSIGNSGYAILNKGVYVWSSFGTNTNIEYEIYQEQLGFCGRSGATGEEVTCGVPVSGADGCKFNPINSKIYPITGGNAISASSHTVPVGDCVLAFQQGDRHICGYKEETCSANTDCDGHTYGRYECNGRTLQEYGCRTFGTAVALEQDRLPSNPNWGETNDDSIFGKRCEIISARTVQCCGDTDCGSNMFCDNTGSSPSWTCKSEVECTNDYDCGVSQQCDYTTLKLKTPECNNGQCSYAEKTVQCCNDGNCASGYFCNAEKKCEKKLADCSICPYECCENECTAKGGFLDRPCTSDSPYCVDHSCSKTPAISDAGTGGSLANCELRCKSTYNHWYNKMFLPFCNLRCRIINFFQTIAYICGGLAFIFSMLFTKDLIEKRKLIKGKKRNIFQWIIALIVGLLIGWLVITVFWLGVILFIVYWIVKKFLT